MNVEDQAKIQKLSFELKRSSQDSKGQFLKFGF